MKKVSIRQISPTVAIMNQNTATEPGADPAKKPVHVLIEGILNDISAEELFQILDGICFDYIACACRDRVMAEAQRWDEVGEQLYWLKRLRDSFSDCSTETDDEL